MNKTTIDLRVIQLKAMDDFMHSVNNEELIDEWLTYGVPDEAQLLKMMNFITTA